MIKKIRAFLGLSYYISPPDLFLASLDQKYYKLSASQQAEIKKYQRISKLRDSAVPEHCQEMLWDEF